eukprot:scaffold13150_cov62-Phaeocystis_antarctica.AAC.6
MHAPLRSIPWAMPRHTLCPSSTSTCSPRAPRGASSRTEERVPSHARTTRASTVLKAAPPL